jgi:hypothetical protein
MPKPKNNPPDVDVFTPERMAELQRISAPKDAAPPAQPVRPQPAPALLRQYPPLPPAAMFEGHDAGLAELIRAAEVAAHDAQMAALDLEQAGDGRPGHAAVMAAERENTFAALEVTGDIPGDPAGPLFVFLTETRPALTVAAARAESRADWADNRVRTYSRLGREGKLTRKLDKASDEVEAEMATAFATAEASKDRSDYLAARKMGTRWAELTSVYVWCLNPLVRFMARPKEMTPRGLAHAEWKADIATGGPPRPWAPLEPEDQATLDALNRGEEVGVPKGRRRRG